MDSPRNACCLNSDPRGGLVSRHVGVRAQHRVDDADVPFRHCAEQSALRVLDGARDDDVARSADDASESLREVAGALIQAEHYRLVQGYPFEERERRVSEGHQPTAPRSAGATR